MAGNIIPAIATTNAIVAGLCVLESFKVLRGEFSATKEVFLSPFAPERLLSSDRYRAPNPDCPVCSVAQVQLLVDMSRATLNDLVEDFLRLELGYGEEIVVNHGDSLLYDVEETDNLTKKLGELGIKSDSFLTVIDEDDENPKGPRVNLVLSVQESETLGDKPIKGVDLPASAVTENDAPASPILRKKKPSQPSNGTYGTVAATTTNGSLTVSNGTKRLFSEVEEGSSPKRVKLATNGDGSNDNAIVIDDGAIVIDD